MNTDLNPWLRVPSFSTHGIGSSDLDILEARVSQDSRRLLYWLQESVSMHMQSSACDSTLFF